MEIFVSNFHIDLNQQSLEIESFPRLKPKIFATKGFPSATQITREGIEEKEKKSKKLKFYGCSEYASFTPQSEETLSRTLYGNIIKGETREGKLHGNVEIKFNNGDYFQGLYENGTRISGKYKFVNGDVYQGQFRGTEIEGRGSLKIEKENIEVSGEWRNRKIKDVATVKYLNGDIYIGGYWGMKKNGKGKYFFKDGMKFVGYFQNGKAHGRGMLLDRAGQILTAGEWSQGKIKEAMRESKIGECLEYQVL